MICQICKDAGALTRESPPDTPLQELIDLHKDCKGETHCDCQHRPGIITHDGRIAQRR